MPFQLSLYRAPEGLGPLISWDREHRAPLGTREQLRAALDRILPSLRWEASDRMLFATCWPEDDTQSCEITLFGGPGETLLEISVYAFPPTVRAIMSGLDLNYCHAQESGELYFPFGAGDRWPGPAP